MMVCKVGIVPFMELMVCLENHTDNGKITVALRA